MSQNPNYNLENLGLAKDETEDTFSSKGSLAKVGAVVGSVVLGATNSFALAATDFATGTAEADMGLAAVAMIGLAVAGAGFAFIRKIIH
ncbi:MAG: hypothetical protein ACI8WT_003135 [Clostridium sp.]|jgi:hypothetical protein